MTAPSSKPRVICNCHSCTRAEVRRRLTVAGWALLIGPIISASIFYQIGTAYL